jgi:hypothetical protein
MRNVSPTESMQLRASIAGVSMDASIDALQVLPLMAMWT